MFDKINSKIMRKEFRQKLADDLKLLRKTKNISFEQLYEDYGIPLWLLEEIETTQGTFRFEIFMSLYRIYEKYPVIVFKDKALDSD